MEDNTLSTQLMMADNLIGFATYLRDAIRSDKEDKSRIDERHKHLMGAYECFINGTDEIAFQIDRELSTNPFGPNTKQYMDFCEQMAKQQLELAGVINEIAELLAERR